ncbi:MAG: SurA N-terminal domain-containing protein [Pseudomonadota bacterium]
MAQRKVSNTLVWILLGLLILALAGTGIGGFGGSGSAIARVGSAEVTANDYSRAIQGELSQLQAQAGRGISFREAQAFGLDQVVLSRLTGDAALEDQATQAGISVGDDRIGEAVQTNPAFVGIDGGFDRAAYQFTLRQNGLNTREFEETLRTDLSRQIVQSAIVGGIAPPDAYIDTVLTFMLEGRDVTWAALTEDNLSEPLPEPSESDLIAYHGANEEAFTLGETKVLTIASLTPQTMLETIEIAEDDIRAAYESRRAAFDTPERRLVERLVFPDTAAAEAAKAAVEDGNTTFEALVEERGLTMADVDFGEVTEAGLDAAGEIVFAADGPGIVGPAETSLGPALFRINAILDVVSISFEEARDNIREVLATDEARAAILDEIEPADDLLAGGATLEELADETAMTLSTLDWRPGITEGLAAYDEIRTAAAQVTQDDFPELIELDDGGLAALRLDETVPPRLQPLDEVRDEVEAAWRETELITRLGAEARALAAEIEAGREMAGIDIPLNWDRGLTRSDFIDGAPEGFIDAIFAMEPGEVRVIEGPGQAVIARLEEVAPPGEDDANSVAIRGILAGQISQSLGQDLLVGFMEAARSEAGVRIDQGMLNAVHAQIP